MSTEISEAGSTMICMEAKCTAFEERTVAVEHLAERLRAEHAHAMTQAKDEMAVQAAATRHQLSQLEAAAAVAQKQHDLPK